MILGVIQHEKVFSRLLAEGVLWTPAVEAFVDLVAEHSQMNFADEIHLFGNDLHDISVSHEEHERVAIEYLFLRASNFNVNKCELAKRILSSCSFNAGEVLTIALSALELETDLMSEEEDMGVEVQDLVTSIEQIKQFSSGLDWQA